VNSSRWRRLRIRAALKLDPFDWSDETRRYASNVRVWLDEVPDESEYTELPEVSPATKAALERIGDELHEVASREAAARRSRRARWRRPSVATGTAAMALVLVAAGGATAVGIEVPVVGGILDSAAPERSPVHQPVPRVSASDALDLPAGLENTSDLLAVPVGGTSGEVIGAGYVGSGNHVCFGARIRGGGLDTVSMPRLGCWEPAAMAQRLNAVPSVVSGYEFGEPNVVAGYARAGVEAISVRDPRGPLTVSLSEPWRPGGLGVPPLRVFLAVTHANLQGDGSLDSDDLDRAMEPGYYKLRARMADGSIVTIDPLRGSP
jgi:hypothetical protein